jgi:hypothetical protein
LPRVVASIGRNFPDVLAALHQRFVRRIGIPRGRRLHGNSKHGTRFQIHRMLGFVSQMHSAIFHLRDLRIGIVRALPVVVVALLLPLAVQLCQLFAGWRLDTRFFRQTFQKFVITLTVIFADDERSAALASSVVPSTETVLPFSSPSSASIPSSHRKTLRYVSTSISLRVRKSSSDPVLTGPAQNPDTNAKPANRRFAMAPRAARPKPELCPRRMSVPEVPE